MTPFGSWAFRRAVSLLAIVLIVPSTAAIATADRAALVQAVHVVAIHPASDGSVQAVAGAPGAVSVSSIQFALDRDSGNNPRDVGTTFRFGPRGIYAFFDYRDANPGDTLQYVFRLVDPSIDINFGDIITDRNSGRASVFLERQDRDYLMLGRFDFVVRSGSTEFARASFDILDDESGSRSAGGNDNSEDNRNDNSEDNNNDNN